MAAGQQWSNATDLAAAVAKDPALQREVKDDPVSALSRLAAPAFQSDKWVYRMVVLSLGLTMLSVVGTSFALFLRGHRIPDVLVAIGTAAVGAIAGLLAPSPGR